MIWRLPPDLHYIYMLSDNVAFLRGKERKRFIVERVVDCTAQQRYPLSLAVLPAIPVRSFTSRIRESLPSRWWRCVAFKPHGQIDHNDY